jgi:hypothetical protein
MKTLKQYHLLKNGKRFSISEKIKRGSEIVNSVIAYNWLDAKAKLGYTLTPQQSLVLKRSLRDDSES